MQVKESQVAVAWESAAPALLTSLHHPRNQVLWIDVLLGWRPSWFPGSSIHSQWPRSARGIGASRPSNSAASCASTVAGLCSLCCLWRVYLSGLLASLA